MCLADLEFILMKSNGTNYYKTALIILCIAELVKRILYLIGDTAPSLSIFAASIWIFSFAILMGGFLYFHLVKYLCSSVFVPLI
jgi:hypothetical protein